MNYKHIRYKVIYDGGKPNKLSKSNKTFNLDKKHDFGDDVQDNIKKLINQYGENFTIKFNKIKIKVRMVELTSSNGIKFYALVYDEPKRTTDLFPLKIYFIDNLLMEFNNNSYISNIHKIDGVSGTEMVKIALKINEVLGVRKTRICDGTSIECGENHYDLSFIKLLEKGETFYMRFGFKYEITNTEYYRWRFDNVDDLQDQINDTIKKIKKIKIDDIIKEYEELLEVIKRVIIEQNDGKLEIVLSEYGAIFDKNDEDLNTYYKKNPENDIKYLFEECYDVLKILKNFDEETLAELLIRLFNDRHNCSKYNVIYTYIVTSARYKVIYGDHVIVRPYIPLFTYLMALRQHYCYVYEFKKN